VLRNTFGAKSPDVTGNWSKLYNEDFHNYTFTINHWDDKVEEDEIIGPYSTHEGSGNCIKTFGGKP
jgi:hypothetical protein